MLQVILLIKRLQEDIDDDLLLHHRHREGLFGEGKLTVVLRKPIYPNPMFHGNSLIKRLQDDVDDDLLLHRGLREDSLGETEPTVFLRNINYTQINIFTFLRKVFEIAQFCPARGGKSGLMRRWPTVTPGDYA